MGNKLTFTLFAIVLMAMTTVMHTSCKKPDYTNELSKIATEYQTRCPEKQPNGTTLDSVIFKNDTLTFQLSLSNNQIKTLNLDSVRKSIVQGVTENLKHYLVNGNCHLTYRYVSPKSTSTIVITPDDLKNAAPEKADK